MSRFCVSPERWLARVTGYRAYVRVPTAGAASNLCLARAALPVAGVKADAGVWLPMASPRQSSAARRRRSKSSAARLFLRCAKEHYAAMRLGFCVFHGARVCTGCLRATCLVAHTGAFSGLDARSERSVEHGGSARAACGYFYARDLALNWGSHTTALEPLVARVHLV